MMDWQSFRSPCSEVCGPIALSGLLWTSFCWPVPSVIHLATRRHTAVDTPLIDVNDGARHYVFKMTLIKLRDVVHHSYVPL